MKRCAKLLALAAVVATVGLISSSCLMVGDTQIRYVWESSQQNNIISIAASFGDVKYWKETVWYGYWPDVPLEMSHDPKWDGSTQIPDNIWSSTIKSTQYKNYYFPISEGRYTAICTVHDPLYDDTYDIVANYEIKEYLYANGDPRTTYYELAFDVRKFLSGNDKPNTWWYLEDYDNPNARPSLTKTPASPDAKPFMKVIEEENVTYIVLRRPTKA